MVDKSTTLISLPQMVDLALNSPEVGIVNFTVLHSLLHVIVNQLDLGEVNVEFRGSDSERLQNYISTARPGPIVTLTEYTIGADGKSTKKKTRRTNKGKAEEEKGQKDESQKEKEIAIIKKETDSTVPETGSGSFQTIVVVEPASREKVADAPKFAIAITKEQLNKLQHDIKELQRQVKELTEMPGSIGLIEAIRTSKEGSATPLLDMFQILTLVKRLDATEEAMNKLASMMEELAKGQASLAMEHSRILSEDHTNDIVSPSREVVELLVKSQELRHSLDGTIGGTAQIQDLSEQVRNIQERVTLLEQRRSRLSATYSGGSAGGGSANEEQTKPKKKRVSIESDKEVELGNTEPVGTGFKLEGDIDFDSTELAEVPPMQAIAILQRELINLKESFLANDSGVQALREVLELKDALISSTEKSDKMPADVRIGQIDLRVNELKEQVSTLDTVYHQQFSKIKDQAEHLEKEIASVWERIKSGLPGGDTHGKIDSHEITELYNKLVALQEDMSTITETAQKLVSEREGRQTTLEVMAEQIELLKTVKADKEDLEDALADKADACQINRKVSHEQFDAAYDELTKALEENLDKLKTQEELWIQSLNDIQKEIGNKLDKMELLPLKDFINAKLKEIQDKVKKISALRQETEAAGAKSKILRNVNCISCDANVIMRKQTDITLFPKPYAMPPTKNPGPYLAYEMDLLRKQQKTIPSTKNLSMFEGALQFAKSKQAEKDHLCNRYCGGSHTVTTPQQRVMRVGHFMEQWGPEISPVNETMIKGKDGHLYKGRDDTALRALANEKPPGAKVEAPAMVITEFGSKDAKGDRPNRSESGTLAKRERLSSRPKTSVEKLLEEPTGIRPSTGVKAVPEEQNALGPSSGVKKVTDDQAAGRSSTGIKQSVHKSDSKSIPTSSDTN
ncbi:uncharacterized protein LOC115881156 isoform X2 [Sitophilus oryzae]|uniref:Uncharacterized protein LOC115881156 isoform X2 n=1 Tax=Sitophilus oryzae TaxID=7048 RepID=A0A6J2XSA9_SITOR|nr:uncharacterized protein LOC115881156 isoform X2 [Sitophilus oryzae]